MATLTPPDRTDLARAARIISAIVIAGPVLAELLHPWLLRFPALGAVVAALEVLWTAYAKQRSAAAPPPDTPRQSSP